uniref:kinesin-like protein KIF17 n=1 Tax=Panthera onca TaxID=9690 RepID=UPI002952FE3D|nr:kinesin-like protein KIF17 [Panthera onca]
MASESVKVVVRCRPMNQRERELNCQPVVTVDSARGQCFIQNPGAADEPPKQFTFDGAYHMDHFTEQIYNEIAYPLVEGVTEGYNGTIFAYGQTGSGKSFTMQGLPDPSSQRGIIPRAFEHVFESVQCAENTKFLVRASYLEIYNEDVRDLLGADSKQKLELKEHPEKGVYVKGLSMHTVHNMAQCERIMEAGWKNRSVGYTLMNKDSSRSHSIFTISIEIYAVGMRGQVGTQGVGGLPSLSTLQKQCLAETTRVSESTETCRDSVLQRPAHIPVSSISFAVSDPLLGLLSSLLEIVTPCFQLRAAEVEIKDLQSEFELEKIDYLATIRRQERDSMLLQQLLEQVQPLIRRDCNYSNLEKIRRESCWDEDNGFWKIPEPIIVKTSLPVAVPTGPQNKVVRKTSAADNGEAGMEEDRYKLMLSRSDSENIASNYFRSKRASQILSMDLMKSLAHHSSPPGLSSPLNNTAAIVPTQAPEMPQPRPFRLESLDIPFTKVKRKKSKSSFGSEPL